MQRKVVLSSRHFLLAFSLGLVLFLGISTHQTLVRALTPPPTTALQGVVTSSFPPTLPSAAWLVSAAPDSTADQQPHRDRLAMSTEPLTRQEAVQVAQAATPQAVGDWQSASFPVENFQTYTSPFGYRRSPFGGYSQEFHYGLDLAAPEGSYIRSWWTGEVVEVSDDSNCGTSVVIESGPWLHIYCHMRGHVESDSSGRYMIDRGGSIQIREGQTVPAGHRIGRVGMTGRTTGPHLHWGLKYNNDWVDPGFVLRAMYASQQQTASR